MIYYYDTPNYCVALIPKTACTSFAKAIIETFYPKINQEIVKTSEFFHGPKYIWYCPRLEKPNKTVVCLFRNPSERFVSAVNQTKINLDLAIDCLINDKDCLFPTYSKPRKIRNDIHFAQQYQWITKDSHLFKFPNDIEEMAKFIGINEKVPHLNQSQNKSFLSNDQLKIIEDYYKLDIEIFNQISSPNTILPQKLWLDIEDQLC